MKDIALAAGVSLSTVSLALKNSPRVKDATRQKVQAIARDLGYQANPLVSALMSARRRGVNPDTRPSLALLTGHSTLEGWKVSSTLREFHAAAHRRIEERGYHLDEFWRYEPGMTDARLAQILRARGVRGLLLFPFAVPSTRLDLNWSDLATVAIGFSIDSHAFDRVGSDHFRAMRTAVRQCHRLGYRRIGFAAPVHMLQRVDGRWLASYLAALRELPEPPPPLLLNPVAWNPAEIQHWLRTDRPDVIITSEEESLAALTTAVGLAIPEEIGFVSLSVPTRDHHQSGMFQNPHLQASRAVDLLIDQIMRNQFGLADAPMHCLIEATWVPGTTVRPQD